MASDRPTKAEQEIIALLKSIDRRLANIEKQGKGTKTVLVEERPALRPKTFGR